MKRTNDVANSTTNGISRGYWISASLFSLQMGFTAYAQLRLPQVAEAFTHLAVGDDASKWSWAVGTAMLGGLSYYFFRRRSPGEGRDTLTSRGVQTA